MKKRGKQNLVKFINFSVSTNNKTTFSLVQKSRKCSYACNYENFTKLYEFFDF